MHVNGCGVVRALRGRNAAGVGGQITVVHRGSGKDQRSMGRRPDTKPGTLSWIAGGWRVWAPVWTERDAKRHMAHVEHEMSNWAGWRIDPVSAVPQPDVILSGTTRKRADPDARATRRSGKATKGAKLTRIRAPRVSGVDVRK